MNNKYTTRLTDDNYVRPTKTNQDMMTQDEIEAYINGVKGATNYPNSIDKDIKILELLNKIEESDGGF